MGEYSVVFTLRELITETCLSANSYRIEIHALGQTLRSQPIRLSSQVIPFGDTLILHKIKSSAPVFLNHAIKINLVKLLTISSNEITDSGSLYLAYLFRADPLIQLGKLIQVPLLNNHGIVTGRLKLHAQLLGPASVPYFPSVNCSPVKDASTFLGGLSATTTECTLYSINLEIHRINIFPILLACRSHFNLGDFLFSTKNGAQVSLGSSTVSIGNIGSTQLSASATLPYWKPSSDSDILLSATVAPGIYLNIAISAVQILLQPLTRKLIYTFIRDSSGLLHPAASIEIASNGGKTKTPKISTSRLLLNSALSYKPDMRHVRLATILLDPSAERLLIYHTKHTAIVNLRAKHEPKLGLTSFVAVPGILSLPSQGPVIIWVNDKEGKTIAQGVVEIAHHHVWATVTRLKDPVLSGGLLLISLSTKFTKQSITGGTKSPKLNSRGSINDFYSNAVRDMGICCSRQEIERNLHAPCKFNLSKRPSRSVPLGNYYKQNETSQETKKKKLFNVIRTMSLSPDVSPPKNLSRTSLPRMSDRQSKVLKFYNIALDVKNQIYSPLSKRKDLNRHSDPVRGVDIEMEIKSEKEVLRKSEHAKVDSCDSSGSMEERAKVKFITQPNVLPSFMSRSETSSLHESQIQLEQKMENQTISLDNGLPVQVHNSILKKPRFVSQEETDISSKNSDLIISKLVPSILDRASSLGNRDSTTSIKSTQDRFSCLEKSMKYECPFEPQGGSVNIDLGSTKGGRNDGISSRMKSSLKLNSTLQPRGISNKSPERRKQKSKSSSYRLPSSNFSRVHQGLSIGGLERSDQSNTERSGKVTHYYFAIAHGINCQVLPSSFLHITDGNTTATSRVIPHTINPAYDLQASFPENALLHITVFILCKGPSVTYNVDKYHYSVQDAINSGYYPTPSFTGTLFSKKLPALWLTLESTSTIPNWSESPDLNKVPFSGPPAVRAQLLVYTNSSKISPSKLWSWKKIELSWSELHIQQLCRGLNAPGGAILELIEPTHVSSAFSREAEAVKGPLSIQKVANNWSNKVTSHSSFAGKWQLITPSSSAVDPQIEVRLWSATEIENETSCRSTTAGGQSEYSNLLLLAAGSVSIKSLTNLLEHQQSFPRVSAVSTGYELFNNSIIRGMKGTLVYFPESDSKSLVQTPEFHESVKFDPLLSYWQYNKENKVELTKVAADNYMPDRTVLNKPIHSGPLSTPCAYLKSAKHMCTAARLIFFLKPITSSNSLHITLVRSIMCDKLTPPGVSADITICDPSYPWAQPNKNSGNPELMSRLNTVSQLQPKTKNKKYTYGPILLPYIPPQDGYEQTFLFSRTITMNPEGNIIFSLQSESEVYSSGHISYSARRASEYYCLSTDSSKMPAEIIPLWKNKVSQNYWWASRGVKSNYKESHSLFDTIYNIREENLLSPGQKPDSIVVNDAEKGDIINESEKPEKSTVMSRNEKNPKSDNIIYAGSSNNSNKDLSEATYSNTSITTLANYCWNSDSSDYNELVKELDLVITKEKTSIKNSNLSRASSEATKSIGGTMSYSRETNQSVCVSDVSVRIHSLECGFEKNHREEPTDIPHLLTSDIMLNYHGNSTADEVITANNSNTEAHIKNDSDDKSIKQPSRKLNMSGTTGFLNQHQTKKFGMESSKKTENKTEMAARGLDSFIPFTFRNVPSTDHHGVQSCEQCSAVPDAYMLVVMHTPPPLIEPKPIIPYIPNVVNNVEIRIAIFSVALLRKCNPTNMSVGVTLQQSDGLNREQLTDEHIRAESGAEFNYRFVFSNQATSSSGLVSLSLLSSSLLVRSVLADASICIRPLLESVKVQCTASSIRCRMPLRSLSALDVKAPYTELDLTLARSYINCETNTFSKGALLGIQTAGDGRPLFGFIEMQIDIVPTELITAENTVGQGRSEPNRLPRLLEPSGRGFNDLVGGISNMTVLSWYKKKKVWIVIVVGVVLLLIIIILIFQLTK